MKLSILNNNPGAEATLSERLERDGVLLFDLRVTFPEPTAPKPIVLKWKIPCVDAYAVWNASGSFSRHLGIDWQKRTCRSRLASGAPFYAILSGTGENRMTVALSDPKTPCEIASGVKEETSEITCEVRFFTDPVGKLTSYAATIRMDTRPLDYCKTLRDADRFLAEDCGYPSAHIPSAARAPMYSTWYSFHQNIDVEKIVKQCALAKEYGMESVIVDDGWQTDDASRGYAYCGDWEANPKKVADMKAFVNRVHALGMKFLLWFSVPFVGIHSKAYERFSTMFLDGDKSILGNDWAILDPRYPEVRAYLVDLYVKAKKEWGLDGFKLDFIDEFRLFKQTKTFDTRRDTASLEDGVDKLLSEITKALRAIDPDILIEFRQSYFGPAVRKYGNMIRVTDCPNDPLVNHVRSTDLRLVSDHTPIHSDMMMWNKDDSAEAVAHQLLSSLFTVPQISVLLDEIPEAHKKVLGFWLSYWKENHDILLDGTFSAKSPEQLYTQVKAEKDGKMIAVAYADSLLSLGVDCKLCSLDFINATSGDTLVIKAEQPLGAKSYRVLDCQGNEIASGSLDLSATHAFSVPRGGRVEIF